MSIQQKKLSPDKALLRLEALCARAERSSGEAREKLRRWGISQHETESIISSLVKRRFIDDSRFAQAFVVEKVRYAFWGRIKIRIQLRAKGVDAITIEDAISQIDEPEYGRILRELLAEKARHLDISDYKERAKLYRYGLSRGFESDLVAAEVRRLRDAKQS